ncbi:hypothetical protein [Pedobacter segetis]|uniref:hypothetical protein n=1 Tax=Pedobacter segetis TaxID=2793069 RepID=UPI00190A8E25|nr:hypothetical protein [Pedobacter segetis]
MNEFLMAFLIVSSTLSIDQNLFAQISFLQSSNEINNLIKFAAKDKKQWKRK